MSNISYLTGAFRLAVGLSLLGACAGSDGSKDGRHTGGTATQQTGGVTSNTGGTPATQKTGGDMASGGTTGSGTGGMMTVDPPDASNGDYFFSDDPTRNDVVAGNVCDRVTRLQCAGEQTCCSNPGRSFDDCYLELIDSCRNKAYVDAMTANKITGFDPARAKSALEMLEQLAMACDTSVASWAESSSGLRGIMQGTRPSGASCFPFSTQRDVAAANLASCENPDAVSCLPMNNTSWVCAPRGDVGGTCVTDANCIPGLYCPQKDYLNPALDSNCADRLADGSPCISNNECKSYACKSGSCAALDVDAAYCLN